MLFISFGHDYAQPLTLAIFVAEETLSIRMRNPYSCQHTILAIPHLSNRHLC